VFGVPWLGKAYFIAAVVGSLLTAWWFDVFSEDSFSRTLLRLFFRWLPVWLLWHSTSSKDLAGLCVLMALFSDAIMQALLTLQIAAAASQQTPTYEYSGQKVTKGLHVIHQLYRMHANPCYYLCCRCLVTVCLWNSS
jgi:hypothetical protein